MECQRAREVHKAVVDDVENQVGAAVGLVVEIGVALVEQAPELGVQGHDALSRIEGLIEFEPAPTGCGRGQETRGMLPLVDAAVALHGDDGSGRQTQRVECGAVRQVERQHGVDDQVVVDVLLLGIKLGHGQVAVLHMPTQPQGAGKAPIGVKEDGEGLAFVVGLQLPPVHGNLGISFGLDVLCHDAADVGLQVVERVAPQVAGHALHHQRPRHETDGHVPPVIAVVAVIECGQHLVAAQVIDHGLIPHGTCFEHMGAIHHREAHLGGQACEEERLVGGGVILATLAVVQQHTGINTPFHLLGVKRWNREQ